MFKCVFVMLFVVMILCGFLVFLCVFVDVYVLMEVETLNKYESCYAANGVGAR